MANNNSSVLNHKEKLIKENKTITHSLNWGKVKEAVKTKASQVTLRATLTGQNLENIISEFFTLLKQQNILTN